MVLVRLGVFVILCSAAVGTREAFQNSPSNRPWPPEVQKVSDVSPPLTPEDALKTFYMPPGYRVELVAAEPLIQEPVAIDWDPDGRLWAVEMPGFMANLTGSNEHDPIGRVVVLEDRNDDGRMDTRTVFADGLVLARSLKVLDRGILVAEPPNVWLMRDTNGDLRMDAKTLVTNRYGRREGDPQNNANGFFWAIDNRMYTAGQADIHLRLKRGAFEVHGTLQRGEWGVTQDDAGRIYRNTNESALHVDYVPTAYYARNPNLLRTRGSYERLDDEAHSLDTVWPVRPNPGTNRAYQTGIDRADGSLAKFTSVCAPLVYRGDRLPADLHGNVFVAEPAANLVSRLVLDDDGRGLVARKAYERGEFLASTDERFRPVYVSDAPDGTLYIVDMYRGIIEHRISITVYLRDQILSRKLDQGTGFGRIYRVVHETTRRNTTEDLSNVSPSQLVQLLSHQNGWRRDTAQRLLVERLGSQGSESPEHARTPDTAVVASLVNVAESAPDWRTRLHALWTLDGIDAIEPTLVTEALEDARAEVRTAAVRIAERWLAEPNHALQAAVLERLDDPEWSVRRQLAASIGTMPTGVREAAAIDLLDRYGDDAVTLDAVLSGLRGVETMVLEELLRPQVRLKPDTTAASTRAAAITMLAATIVRSAQDAAIQRVLGWIAEGTRASWQRAALLDGAEVALLGRTIPGTRVRSDPTPTAATALPCSTCPGGRAGPGGAYAFTRPPAPAAGRGGSRLRLNRAPAEFSALAAGADDFGSRIANVLTRITWPGKPGDATTIPPLTPAEQRRLESGREVYQNICQACHQPDGRGQDKVAPTLIGSSLTLTDARIPTRILLNGKEGVVGLMPPVGSTLSDEQVASVLTYIRREWGQTGTPVDPATVKAVRRLTAGRARPWTDAELLALVGRGDRR